MVNLCHPVHVVVSQEEFARRAGVSAVAIHKAIKSGRIVRNKKGIDLSHPLSVDYLSRHTPGGKSESMKQQKRPTSTRGRQNVTQISAQTVNIAPQVEEEKDQVLQLSLQERVEKVRKLRIQNAIARGQYIQREVIRLWWRMVSGVLLSSFRDLDERIMPTISAACRSAASEAESISSGGAILRKEIHDGLNSVGKAAADFHDEPPDPAEGELDAGDTPEGFAMD